MMNRVSPDNGYIIKGYGGVSCQDRQILQLTLDYQHSVEWISMNMGQAVDLRSMANLDW
jgi:hypothetical protein